MHARGGGNVHARGRDMHARLLPARLPPDWEVGQIARLPPPVCFQINFDYPVADNDSQQSFAIQIMLRLHISPRTSFYICRGHVLIAVYEMFAVSWFICLLCFSHWRPVWEQFISQVEL